MRILGIDEAGRGPVLGPLVVAGVVSDDPETLRALGVRDSKRLSPQRRRGLAEAVESTAGCHITAVSARELDAAMAAGSLNDLEAALFADLIRTLAPDEAVVDCCDPVESRFRATILRRVGYDLPLRAEHRADERYPVVSAASIVAKVKRDEAMARIEEELGQPVGSGYAHDPRTQSFLEAWVAERGELPPHARRAWKTARRLLARVDLRKLTEWE